MNDESSHSGITAELEARIVALLLGEASDFERDELERLIEERADVRDFRNQMRVVYGLLEHAVGDAPADWAMEFMRDGNLTQEFQEEWKLSEDKRSTVLALFADQEVTGKNSAADIDRMTEHKEQGAGSFSGAVVRNRSLAETTMGKSTESMVQRSVRLVLEHRVLTTAAGLLVLFGCASVWLTSTEDYAVTSSLRLSDSESIERSAIEQDFEAQVPAERPMGAAKAPLPPMAAKPSESAGSGGRAWFGRNYSADVEKAERPQPEEMLDDEFSESEALPENANAGLDADMDMDMDMDMGGRTPRFSGRQEIIEVEEDVRFSFNGRLSQSEDQKELEADFSSPATQGSGVQQPNSQSASTRGPSTLPPATPKLATPKPTVSPSSSLFLGETEPLNRASRKSGERGQAEKQNQPVVVDQSLVDGTFQGLFGGVQDQSGQDQSGGSMGGGGPGGGGGGMGGGMIGGMIGDSGMGDSGMGGGGMGGGGMGGGGMGDMGMEGAIAARDKNRGVPAGGGTDVEERLGDKRQQQAVGQALEKNLSLDKAKRSFAAADPFGGKASESKTRAQEGSILRPSSGVPMPSQPSVSVNGPGPGLLDSDGIEAQESGGEIQQSFSQRVSGLDSNFAGGRQAESAKLIENDEIAFDRIAKLGEKKAKDGLNRKSASASAKKRKLAILGKKTDQQTSVPSGFPEIDASANGFSTFSLHVSDVAFKLAQAALNKGEWPDASRIRSEEFLNAFDYGDPMPTQNERVSCRIEQSIHPFLQQRNLLRVAMRTAAAGRSSSTPLRLTFLLDNSGSMERLDRQQTVRRAFAVLAQQLKPIDEVTLISFARQPRLLADRISGAAAGSLVQTIENLPSEGGTNLEAALSLAFEKAQEQYQENAQNRIILLTDGAVNLGDASPERLADMIVTMRNRGIAFDAAGISADGLNDEVLEALTRKGDGRYYLLDSLESVEDGFAKQIAGALRPAAKNVKIQVVFNPERVGKYKLLGFEKHRLKREDFRNDKVDAAEMAAAEAGVALYQVQAKPDGYGDVGTVSVRFRDLETGQMVEEIWPIPYETSVPRSDLASPSMKIATAASLFASKLKGGVMADTVDLKELASLLASLAPEIRNNQRIRKLEVMIQQARQINGN